LKRDLLELHLVDTGRGRAHQHSRREESALHDCDHKLYRRVFGSGNNSQYRCFIVAQFDRSLF
jgi:hypothetical protein